MGWYEAPTWLSQLPTSLSIPRSGLSGKQLHSWVPPRALLHWDAASAAAGPCCLSGFVTKEPGLAARDGLELSVLWRWR